MFLTATLRPPEPAERNELIQLYHEQLATFQQNVADRDALLNESVPQRPSNSGDSGGEGKAPGDPTAATSLDPSQLAAWTVVANVILNLDEVVTKE